MFWRHIMKILVVGLGLIGGSLCKAIKKYTDHSVIGLNRTESTAVTALSEGAIDKIYEEGDSPDLVIISLFPEASENWLRDHAAKLNKNALITEVCGIKGQFSHRMKKLAEENGLRYIGIHPMAGKEFGGYKNSFAELFQKANFIIAPFADSADSDIELLKGLVTEIGAGKIVVTSPEDHDKMIAYTSQLAHVVSSAYVKSPELALECGFSGGSFQDMTRIATMNENMWTDLFMQNRENLLFELDTLIDSLKEYSDALRNGDAEAMVSLIAEGRRLKEENLRNRLGQPN